MSPKSKKKNKQNISKTPTLACGLYQSVVKMTKPVHSRIGAFVVGTPVSVFSIDGVTVTSRYRR